MGKTVNKRIRHGLTKHPYYGRWMSIMQRCFNEDDPAYKDYGARGIKVSDEFKDTKTFLEYIEKLPGYAINRNVTIDRTDNDLGYQPGNLRMATRKEQAANRRRHGLYKSSTSGYSGISFHSLTGKIRAYLYIHKKMVHIGHFENIKEAVDARNNYILANNISLKLQDYKP